ncbi:hypothetical protein LO762_03510 [Actinocorallia sp. API 0066]|uniref:lipopolysaccharide biosynthesis protein n=1 Tax=Actinocorallia sp. API 0066 TaxID=2896846 RepID=UPI001E620B4E|nr:hypothetical protein [Actinocorallia sp. API 0066]MCD0448266.1 hypothetical protein [Actinocorallia sp. API 0066]
MADRKAPPGPAPGEAPAAAPTAPKRLAWLRGELGNPLFRNAYALMLNGGLTGVLGLGFWIAARHFHSQDDFGRNAAVIQAVMCIGGMTTLSYVLMRFIPQAGRSSGRLILATYLFGSVLAVLLGIGFVLSLAWWDSPNYDQLADPSHAIPFIIFIAAWNIFTQQDAALTGLRHAGWVPVKNTLYGLVKFVMLAGLAWTFAPNDGILLATMIPVIFLVLPMDWFVFRRLLPEHEELTKDKRHTPTPREIGRYLQGDFIGTVASHSAINFIPLLVAAKVSEAANGFFAMAWIFGLMLDLLALNMAMSLTVEGSHATDNLASTCRDALRRTLMLLVPVSLVVAFAGPWVLGLPFLFGAEFKTEAGFVLVLLALSTLPKALIELYVGVLRVRSRTRLVALIQLVRFAGVVIGVGMFVHDDHLAAVGWSVLLVQSAVALAVLPRLRKAARAQDPPPAPPAQALSPETPAAPPVPPASEGGK